MSWYHLERVREPAIISTAFAGRIFHITSNIPNLVLLVSLFDRLLALLFYACEQVSTLLVVLGESTLNQASLLVVLPVERNAVSCGGAGVSRRHCY
jgi:hypothetical protein